MKRLLLLLIAGAILLIAGAAIGRKMEHMAEECDCACHRTEEQND